MAVHGEASVEDHLDAITRGGEAYLAAALAPEALAASRGRALLAALRYLERRARQSAPQSAAGPSQVVMTQLAPTQPAVVSSFESVLAAAIDHDIPIEALVEACATAADAKILPVLTKCLCILASHRSALPDVFGADCDPGGVNQDGNVVMRADSDGENEPRNGSLSRGDKHIDSEDEVASVRKGATGNAKLAKGSHKRLPAAGRTGQAFVDEFMTKLVDNEGTSRGRAETPDDLFVATAAREAPLSPSAARHALAALVCRMSEVELLELPAYIYQTLLFVSARGSTAAKRKVLLGITRLFSTIERQTQDIEHASQFIRDHDEDAIVSSSATLRDVRQVQGASLLHIEFAIKQDPSLIAEVMKLTRSGVECQEQFLTTFGAAILLALARAPAVQMDVLNGIRDAVVRFDRERVRRKKNLFAACVSRSDDELLDPQASLLTAAERTSADGWEFVSETLLQLGFVFIDRPISTDAPENLGERLVSVLFCAHKAMQANVMEQLVSRVVLREKSAPTAVRVLHRLSRQVPLDMLEQSSYVRDCIEDLVTLPPWMATALIDAFRPLLRRRRDLQDYLFLVMRKALFHRENSNRAVAAIGFLNIMSSVGQLSCNESRGASSNGSLSKADLESIQDTAQPLRRVLSHPAALRAFMYMEASKVLLSTPPGPTRLAIAGALHDLLKPHFLRFIDATEAPYLLIEHCVNEASGGALVEPLGDLIRCLSVVEANLGEDLPANSYILELARKLSSVSIQDFAISKDSSSVVAGVNSTGAEEQEQELAEEAAARANRNRARVLGSVAESLIHAVLSMPQDVQSPSLFEDVLFPLLRLRGSVYDVLRFVGSATPSDALRDLDGDLTIERSRGSARFGNVRPGRSGATTKKNNLGKKKSSGANGGTGSGNAGAGSVSEHRFGVFSVLASGASSPTVSLNAAIRCLEAMGGLHPDRDSAMAKFFDKRLDSRDVSELQSYLFAVAQKHVENTIEVAVKYPEVSLSSSNDDLTANANAIFALARLAMHEFKRSRRSTAAVSNSVGGIRALQVAGMCGRSLSTVLMGRQKSVEQFCAALLPSQPNSAGGTGDDSMSMIAIPSLEGLTDTLLGDEMFKEAAVVLLLYSTLVESVIANMDGIDDIANLREGRSLWSRRVLTTRKGLDAGTVKSLAAISMAYTSNNDDLRAAGEIIVRLHEVIGDCDVAAEPKERSESEPGSLVQSDAIEQGTSLAAVDAVLDVSETALSDVEWCLGRMSSFEASAHVMESDTASSAPRKRARSSAHDDSDRVKITSGQMIRAEEAAQTRLEGIVKNLNSLAHCAIEKWAQQERLLKMITRTYRDLSIAAQAQCRRRCDPRTPFISMLAACKDLPPTLWTYLAFLGNSHGDGSAAKTSTAVKEARVMPQLVYEVEKFEKLLISAQKHTKIPLLRGMRQNTARDFMIHVEELNQESGADNSELEYDESQDRRKRRR